MSNSLLYGQYVQFLHFLYRNDPKLFADYHHLVVKPEEKHGTIRISKNGAIPEKARRALQQVINEFDSAALN